MLAGTTRNSSPEESGAFLGYRVAVCCVLGSRGSAGDLWSVIPALPAPRLSGGRSYRLVATALPTTHVVPPGPGDQVDLMTGLGAPNVGDPDPAVLVGRAVHGPRCRRVRARPVGPDAGPAAELGHRDPSDPRRLSVARHAGRAGAVRRCPVHGVLAVHAPWLAKQPHPRAVRGSQPDAVDRHRGRPGQLRARRLFSARATTADGRGDCNHGGP